MGSTGRPGISRSPSPLRGGSSAQSGSRSPWNVARSSVSDGSGRPLRKPEEKSSKELLTAEGQTLYWARVRALLEANGDIRNFDDTLKELEKTFRLVGLPASNETTTWPAPRRKVEPPARSQVREELSDERLLSELLGDDLGSIPRPVAPSPSSNERARLRKILERVNSPFLANGDTLMLVPFKEHGKGFILTARFNVEGEANQYNIMAKCKGSAYTLQKEGEDIRIFEDGRAVTLNKDFEALWKGKKIKGALWLNAVYLPVGREFTAWLNNGAPHNGDLVKLGFKIKADGSLSVQDLL